MWRKEKDQWWANRISVVGCGSQCRPPGKDKHEVTGAMGCRPKRWGSSHEPKACQFGQGHLQCHLLAPKPSMCDPDVGTCRHLFHLIIPYMDGLGLESSPGPCKSIPRVAATPWPLHCCYVRPVLRRFLSVQPSVSEGGKEYFLLKVSAGLHVISMEFGAVP